MVIHKQFNKVTLEIRDPEVLQSFEVLVCAIVHSVIGLFVRERTHTRERGKGEGERKSKADSVLSTDPGRGGDHDLSQNQAVARLPEPPRLPSIVHSRQKGRVLAI